MLKIQTPGSKALLHELNRAAKYAELGGGAFAYATRSGVKEFFSQSNIKKLAKNGEFLLVVGIDAVTNFDTICELKKQIQELEGLTVNVFLHPYNSTFHPKLSWYKSKNSVSLVVGSGNMTTVGLGKSVGGRDGNWEAFYTRKLSQKNADNTTKVWRDWITDCRNNGYLHTIDSKQVLKKAAENSRYWPRNVNKKLTKPSKATKPVTIDIEGSEYSNRVQISEISRNRRGQLDIGKDILRDFFGYTSNSSDHKILIQNVNLDNTLDDPETRSLFKNKSQNYRFEVNALKGRKKYIEHNDNRPVVIFTKLGGSAYRYCILMHGNQDYADIIKMLGQRKGRKMRKLDTSIEELRKSAPNLPDQLYPISYTGTT